MVSREYFLAQARRRYPDFLRSIVEGKEFFPFEFRIGKSRRSDAYVDRLAELAEFRAAALALEITVEWKTVNDPRFGRHDRPERAYFSDQTAFLAAIGKTEEVRAFRENVALIAAMMPREWILKNVLAVIENHNAWPQLLRVVSWFRANPCSGLYMRQIPVEGVDTKFYEQRLAILDSLLNASRTTDDAGSLRFEDRYGLRREEPLIRFRFLDQSWRVALGFPVEDLSIPAPSFHTLPFCDARVIITENLRNFLALPKLPKAIGVFGGGNALLLLAGAGWMTQSTIYYWGDIDAHGFIMLSRLRALFPQTVSVMMDEATLRVGRKLLGEGPVAPTEVPSVLTNEEMALYEEVLKNNLRLEQERLPYEYTVAHLGAALAGNT